MAGYFSYYSPHNTYSIKSIAKRHGRQGCGKVSQPKKTVKWEHQNGWDVENPMDFFVVGGGGLLWVMQSSVLTSTLL